MSDAQIVFEILRFVPMFFFLLLCFNFIGQIVDHPLNLKAPRTWLIFLGFALFYDSFLIMTVLFLPDNGLVLVLRSLFILGADVIMSVVYFHSKIKISCGAVAIAHLVYVMVMFLLDFIYFWAIKNIPGAYELLSMDRGYTFDIIWSCIFFYNVVTALLFGIVLYFLLKIKTYIVIFLNQLSIFNLVSILLPSAIFMVLIYYIGSENTGFYSNTVTDTLFCLTVSALSFILLFLVTQNGRIRQLGRESRQALQYAEHLENVMLKTAEDEQLFKDNLLALKNFYQRGDYSAMERQLDALLQSEDPLASRNRSLNTLPTGGLKGLLFMKLLEFEKNRMAVDLIFDKDLSHLSPCYLKKQLYYDICKIAGILLDNAQEAAMPCAEPEILIEIYEDDRCLYFSLSNNFCQPFELDKITAAGYTTKEKGRGYGLKLAHQLVSSHSELSLDHKLKGNLFTHTLCVKI